MARCMHEVSTAVIIPTEAAAAIIIAIITMAIRTTAGKKLIHLCCVT